MSEVATRTPAQEVVAQIRSDQFKEQVAMALPENASASRFVRATVTALLENPGIAEAETDSFFAALLKCANDGLLPDGREAALVIFKDKAGVKRAQYISMIGGLRKIAAEYGWSIRTSVVYQADEFDYELGLDIRLTHRPAPVNADRGPAIAAYAIANHRDGRREIEVMSATEIEKVRQVSRAKDSGPWRDWTDRMWEKTVGRRIFPKLALDPGDKRVASVLDAAAIEPGEAANMLYGPHGAARATELENPAPATPNAGAADGSTPDGSEASVAGPVDQQAGVGGNGGASDAAAPALGSDDEPEPGSEETAAATQTSFPVPGAVVAEAAQTRIEFGSHAGKTLTEIHAEKPEWMSWALRHEHKFDEPTYSSVCLFVEHRMPEIWAAFKDAS